MQIIKNRLKRTGANLYTYSNRHKRNLLKNIKLLGGSKKAKKSLTKIRQIKKAKLAPSTIAKRNLSVSPEQFCLINFKRTKNNTYCAISRLFGQCKTLWSISGGQISPNAKSNGRRKTRFTQRMVFNHVTEKLLGFGFKYLVIHCSGTTVSKRYIFKNFYKRFKIVLLKDLTGVPHNGCRAANVRRV